MKKYLSIILLLLIAVISNAQQTIATSGGDAKGNSGSASYTIGQQDYISLVVCKFICRFEKNNRYEQHISDSYKKRVCSRSN